MSADLFRAATAYVEDVTRDLTKDQLGLPTPCPGWAVSAVLQHLSDVADALVGLVESGEMRMPETPVRHHPDPVAGLREAVARLADGASTSRDSERLPSGLQAGTIEFTAHGWDIAVAVNPRHVMPGELADDVLALATSLLHDEARGHNFAAPVHLPATAASSDRLAAFLGRQPAGVVLDRGAP